MSRSNIKKRTTRRVACMAPLKSLTHYFLNSPHSQIPIIEVVFCVKIELNSWNFAYFLIFMSNTRHKVSKLDSRLLIFTCDNAIDYFSERRRPHTSSRNLSTPSLWNSLLVCLIHTAMMKIFRQNKMKIVTVVYESLVTHSRR